MDISPHLNIQVKKDTQAKLLKIAGKPTENYIFAGEFNRMARRLDWLRDMIDLSWQKIEKILEGAVVFELGVIDIDFIEYLNFMYYDFTGTPIFVIFENEVVVGESTQTIKYVYAFNGRQGVYGEGEELVLSSDNFELLFNSSVDESTPEEPEEPEEPTPPKYYEWFGFISQVGTNAPTAEVIMNDFAAIGYRVVFQYIDEGEYWIRVEKIAAPFTAFYVFYTPMHQHPRWQSSEKLFKQNREQNGVLAISTRETFPGVDPVRKNGILSGDPIQIKLIIPA